MAEYKNGVNSFGNMSVDSNDVNADVHTGRVVFVDTDKYEKDTAYKAKIDKCVEDGFFRSDEFGSGGGGGSGGGSLIVNVTEEGSFWTLDKTWKEIKDAISSGSVVYVKNPDIPSSSSDSYTFVTGCGRDETSFAQQYQIYVAHTQTNNATTYYADTENDYPYYNFE